MNEESILAQLNEIFQDIFDDEDLQITPETSSKDIEDWDSLAQITIITMIENKFNIRFELDEIPKVKNVGDMVSIIEQRSNL